jgi:hypothetical protein
MENRKRKHPEIRGTCLLPRHAKRLPDIRIDLYHGEKYVYTIKFFLEKDKGKR